MLILVKTEGTGAVAPSSTHIITAAGGGLDPAGYWFNLPGQSDGLGMMSSAGSIDTATTGNAQTIRAVYAAGLPGLTLQLSGVLANTDAAFVSIDIAGAGTYTRAAATFGGTTADSTTRWDWSGAGGLFTNGNNYTITFNY